MAFCGVNIYSHSMTAEATRKARHLAQNIHAPLCVFIRCIIIFQFSLVKKNIVHNNYSDCTYNSSYV